MRLNAIKFLGTFDPEAAVVETPPPAGTQLLAAPPAVAPAPEVTTIPVQALPAIIDLVSRQEEARNRLVQVRAAEPPPAPEPDPAEQTAAKELATLKKQLAKQNEMLVQMQLETYRANAISAARASGRDLIETLVGGRNAQEIDASVALAAAEYELLRGQIQTKLLADMAAAAPPPAPVVEAPPAAPQAPVGVTHAAAPVQQQPQGFSVPSYVAAPGIPDGQDHVITQDNLNYLTSSAAVQNGDYAKNRHLLHAALRGQSSPGKGWSFQQQNLAPPSPIGQQRGETAMTQNVYAGVQMPQVRAQATAQPRGVAAIPVNPNARALQPVDIQTSDQGQPATQGYVDAASARAAAAQAISQSRNKTPNPSSHH